MRKKKIFGDSEIVEFCRATRDTNEIHDPAFMEKMGKRVIVPGMLAFSCAAGLNPEFLKKKASYIKVLFSSLLSSGDFVTFCAEEESSDPGKVRLSAFNHKDTLTSKNEYTRMEGPGKTFPVGYEGILRRLAVDPAQVEVFKRLVSVSDRDVANFLFAVSYASQALHKSIDEPVTEVEREIRSFIGEGSRVSPFYHTLEILIPGQFPEVTLRDEIDYFIHFEREKPFRLYTAHVRCEAEGKVIFHSCYSLMGIPDRIILRMAKDASHQKHTLTS